MTIKRHPSTGVYVTLTTPPFSGCNREQLLTLATNDLSSHLNIFPAAEGCLSPTTARELRDLLIECYPLEEKPLEGADELLMRLNVLELENAEHLERIENLEAFEQDLKDKFASLVDLGV